MCIKKTPNNHKFKIMLLKKPSVCLTIISSAIFISGCAKSSNDIATQYISPVQYQNMNCSQLTAELVRVGTRVSQLGGELDEASSNDAAITGIGAILFWPALFALGGKGQQEAEYGRVKGEYEALNQATIQKNCLVNYGGNSTQNDLIDSSGSNSSGKLTLIQAGEKCKALGMPVATEQYGKCVLSLTK